MAISGHPSAREFPDVVTQYGHVRDGKPQFRNRPRARIEAGLSVLSGRWSVRDATLLVARRDLRPEDAVRYAQVARLRDVGFSMTPTPTRRNPDHATIEFIGSWDDEVGRLFDDCFTEPVTGD